MKVKASTEDRKNRGGLYLSKCKGKKVKVKRQVSNNHEEVRNKSTKEKSKIIDEDKKISESKNEIIIILDDWFQNDNFQNKIFDTNK